MSSLEEYNINLFLTNLSKLKLPNIDDKLFGEKKEKVFREYENFPDVLNGIAKLSRQLEKMTSVIGYEGDRKMRATIKKSKRSTKEGNYVRGQVNSIYNTNIYEGNPYETKIVKVVLNHNSQILNFKFFRFCQFNCAGRDIFENI